MPGNWERRRIEKAVNGGFALREATDSDPLAVLARTSSRNGFERATFMCHVEVARFRPHRTRNGTYVTLWRGVALTSALVMVVILGLVVFAWQQDEVYELWPCGEISEEIISAMQDVTAFSGDVLGKAHSADDSPEDVDRALDCGADVVEIDVLAFEGRLLAAHGVERAVEGEPPPLGDIWSAATSARAIELNMKSTSPRALEEMFLYLDEHLQTEGPRIIVSTPDVEALRAFQERLPEVERFLSVETESELEALRRNSVLQAMLQGVSIQETLIDATVLNWLNDADLAVWAWTVNDPLRAHELAQLGVQGITTDNHAVLSLLRDDGSTSISQD